MSEEESVPNSHVNNAEKLPSEEGVQRLLIEHSTICVVPEYIWTV